MEDSKMNDMLKTAPKEVRAIYSTLNEKIAKAKIEILSNMTKIDKYDDSRIKSEIEGMKTTIRNLERDLKFYKTYNDELENNMGLIRSMLITINDVYEYQARICRSMFTLYAVFKTAHPEVYKTNISDTLYSMERELLDESDKLQSKRDHFSKIWNTMKRAN